RAPGHHTDFDPKSRGVLPCCNTAIYPGCNMRDAGSKATKNSNHRYARGMYALTTLTMAECTLYYGPPVWPVVLVQDDRRPGYCTNESLETRELPQSHACHEWARTTTHASPLLLARLGRAPGPGPGPLNLQS